MQASRGCCFRLFPDAILSEKWNVISTNNYGGTDWCPQKALTVHLGYIVYFSFPLYDSISLYPILFMTFLNIIELEAEAAGTSIIYKMSVTDCVLKYNISSWMQITTVDVLPSVYPNMVWSYTAATLEVKWFYELRVVFLYL